MAKKLTAGFIIVVLVGAIIFFGFQSDSGEANEGIKLFPVERGHIVDKAIAIGEIEPEKEIAVKSHISGVVQKLFVEENDQVDVGDALFEVSPRSTPEQIVNAELSLQETRVEFENAESEFERVKELFNKNLLSESEYDRSKKTLEMARLDVQRKQEALSLLKEGKTMLTEEAIESVIRAPVAGTVLAIYGEEGDPVEPMTSFQPGTPIMSLADMSNLVFRGTVDEIDVGKLSEGMDVTLKIGALPSDTVRGRLYKIASKARKQDQTTVFDVEIEITEAGPNLLRAGYSATAEIIINEKNDVLMVPERLVNFRNDSSFVDVQDSAGAIKTIPVEVGLSDGLNIEIIAGLDSGQQVVEYPPREIQ
ncbi:MAG TPA: efflux RND transporter periplasmic adaptor subunit [candidate division Zixibacteria bacterium]|nr:efflux RND transporter periplasmic adaptor subunit [candidate division Zixibacteria bacterium]